MKTLLRKYRKSKWTIFVTVLGFAIGLTAALLLLIFIHHESSYDQHWQNADRIFRINTTAVQNNKFVEFPICTRKAYSELPEKVPGIEAAVQIYRTFNPEIKIGDQRFRNLKISYVDSSFFSVFPMQAYAGDLRQALTAPDEIVLNVRTAKKLFGDQNAIGQEVTAIDLSLPEQGQLCHVAAVVPDLPKTTHFDFDVLLPMSANQNTNRMGGLEFYTYYALSESAAIKETINNIEHEFNRMMADWASAVNTSLSPKGRLIPIKQIYLHSHAANEIGPQGDLKTIRIFGILTILILGIAIANYINLFLLQGSNRALETSIRKTVGASQFQLALQFMKESFIITGLAFIIAIYAASRLIGPFGDLIWRPLQIGTLLTPEILMGMIGLFILISVLASVYPAWRLTQFPPIQGLKGDASPSNPRHHFKKGMVMMQFAICMLLLSNLLALQKQFNYMNEQPLGFDSQNVVVFRNLSPQIKKAYPLIKNELSQIPGIASVTGSHATPGSGASGQSIKASGTSDDTKISIREVRVQPDYFQTYGIHLQAGRSFEQDRETDRNAVVLNETAVRALGITEPIASHVFMFRIPMEIIGVVSDYHYASLRDQIRPEVFTYYSDQIRAISIRVNTPNSKHVIEQITEIFKRYDAAYTPNYIFMHDAFRAMYGGEQQLIQFVRIGSILALILTLLGLASITAITVKQRTKEIGIRKAIGAKSSEILGMLVGNQLKMLVGIIIIAGFAAAWIIRNWLQHYAYQTEVTFWIFLMAGFIVLAVSLIITIVISYRAANTNPVTALRYE